MEWSKLASFPNSNWKPSEPIKVNHKEFAHCSAAVNAEYIHKYNIDEDKWSKWIKYPDEHNRVYASTIAIDEQQQTLYMLSGKQMMECSISQKEWKIYQHSLGIRHNARGIIINDEFNIIHGFGNNQHIIWNKKDKTFKIIHQFDGIRDSVYFRLIHLKSKGVLFLIGGHKMSTDLSLKITDDIYSYNIMDKKWTKLTHKLPKILCDFGCVLSRCNKYIIIFGGSSGYNIYDDIIYILDVNTMIFRKSDIRCPRKSSFVAINMNDLQRDSMATFGYVRRLWGFQQFHDVLFLPFYLINMIGSYYYNEWIHLIDSAGSHWKIKLDDILNH